MCLPAGLALCCSIEQLESPVAFALSNCQRKRVFVTGNEIPRIVAHRCVIEELEGRGAACKGCRGGTAPLNGKKSIPNSGILFTIAGFPLTRPCVV
jgi:hypothetical protein